MSYEVQVEPVVGCQLAAKRSRTGVSWEVYGDWVQDPRRLCTDIYVELEAAV